MVSTILEKAEDLANAADYLCYAAARALAETRTPMPSLNTTISIPPSPCHRGGVVTVDEVLVWALSEPGYLTLEANPSVRNGLLEFAARND
jgi:hypothetical protein